MKKVVSILGVLVLSIGLFSCESTSTASEDALYDVEAVVATGDGNDEVEQREN